MARALQLAARGLNACEPNPPVGCVIVDEAGRTLGEGWHARAGQAHAEVHALEAARAAGARLAGATAYVTLEPCAHQGRTPPCARALVNAQLGRVVIAMEDPFAQVAGRGLALLREARIKVDVGLLARQAQTLMRGFLSRLERGRPFVTVKLATSLDGATAMDSGESRWITSPEARADVHHRRARVGAILTGVGTVLADDPAFTVRDVHPTGEWDQPLRVILDSRRRLPPATRLLGDGGRTLVLYEEGAPAEAHAAPSPNVEWAAVTPSAAAGLDLNSALALLGVRGVNEVLVEAGARVNGSLLAAGLVDEIVWYMAPHVMGANTHSAWALPSVKRMRERVELDVLSVDRVGPDMRVIARPAAARGT